MSRLHKFYVKSGDLQVVLTAKNSLDAAMKAFDNHMYPGCNVDRYFVYVNLCGFESMKDDDLTDLVQTDNVLARLGYDVDD